MGQSWRRKYISLSGILRANLKKMIQTLTFWIVLLGSAVVYWYLPERFRLAFLAAVSYLYIVSLDPVVANILIAWVLLFFYAAPHAVANKQYNKLVFYCLFIAILSYLIFHKHLPSLLIRFGDATSEHPILIPLGISYFTFKLIHYLIEVSRGNIRDRSLSKFFCYIFLFPIFTAGPIERFDHFIANIDSTWRSEFTVIGLTRIFQGLAKIAIISLLTYLQEESFTEYIPNLSDLQDDVNAISTSQMWGYVIFAYIIAYMDFSAYCDIAIGASRLFGLTIMENFSWPILATNISDFWKRWHRTLANWCQTYVYMPIIGHTRNPYLAAYGTFITMGLWHGATAPWVMWGLYHASGISIYLTWIRFKGKFRIQKAKNRILRSMGLPITFLFVSGSYVFSSTGNSGRLSITTFFKLFGINVDLGA